MIFSLFVLIACAGLAYYLYLANTAIMSMALVPINEQQILSDNTGDIVINIVGVGLPRSRRGRESGCLDELTVGGLDSLWSDYKDLCNRRTISCKECVVKGKVSLQLTAPVAVSFLQITVITDNPRNVDTSDTASLLVRRGGNTTVFSGDVVAELAVFGTLFDDQINNERRRGLSLQYRGVERKSRDDKYATQTTSSSSSSSSSSNILHIDSSTTTLTFTLNMQMSEYSEVITRFQRQDNSQMVMAIIAACVSLLSIARTIFMHGVEPVFLKCMQWSGRKLGTERELASAVEHIELDELGVTKVNEVKVKRATIEGAMIDEMKSSSTIDEMKSSSEYWHARLDEMDAQLQELRRRHVGGGGGGGIGVQ
jgi:hypothetical protein